MVNHRLWKTLALAHFASIAALAAPNDSNDAVTFAFTIENDVFSGTDQNYTNGAKLSWDYAEASRLEDIGQLPYWAKAVATVTPNTRNEPFSYGATISLGQSIFTPKDKTATELLEGDRPYAGWTYLSLALRESQGRSIDTIELTLGVVGPDSFAEDVQNWVHQKIDSQEALGWDNQLKNELGAVLAWRRDTQLLSFPNDHQGWSVNLNASYGAAVGNIYTHALAGANARVGYNTNSSASPARIRPGSTGYFPSLPEDPRLDQNDSSPGFFFIVGSEARYVARNLFVEGNTWADSHGLPAEDWVADYYAGITLVGSRASLSYIYTHRSEEFVGQDQPHEFGSLTLSWSY